MKKILSLLGFAVICITSFSTMHAMRNGLLRQEAKQARYVAIKEARRSLDQFPFKQVSRGTIEAVQASPFTIQDTVRESGQFSPVRHECVHRRLSRICSPTVSCTLAYVFFAALFLQAVQANNVISHTGTGSQVEDEFVELTIRMPKKLFNEQMDRLFSGQMVDKSWTYQLESPWRDIYQKNAANKTVADVCPFCHQLATDEDDSNLILKRTDNFAVFLNKYPYCKGHLLIIPNAHVKYPSALGAQARAELMDLIVESGEILKEQMHVESYNAGCNIGKDAGASIPEHFHWHVLPRKANEGLAFIHTIAQTNVMPWDQNKLYRLLKYAFNYQCANPDQN